MKFKEGDTIIMAEGCIGALDKNEICVLHKGSRSNHEPHDLWAWGINGECCHNTYWRKLTKQELAMINLKK